ncbi:serine/threonine protein kinase [Capilliphycus salinus ALCB114379]|uniref:serine/threonine protein kinase n=1 Tax=Capilliphycus salinus TaxID=2768948 RepID=UPI0039A537CF
MLTSENILQERYQLQKQLGRTAAGHQTWLSTDLHTQEQVTVKLLAFSPQMEWEELKLFEREAEVLQSLDHRYIPRYRDYFSIDRETGSGLPWFGLVQDYIPGSSLQELIENGKRFTESEVKKIAKSVLEILIYLHQLSPPVLHRDIKPSNLIYGEDKQIYLIDFGSVQAQAHVTGVTFTVVGTSGYAPLEQFWGRAVPASDLYGLGATLIHILTGIPPADLPQKESRIQFSDRVTINPHFISWLEAMTEIALEKRFPTSTVALECLVSNQEQDLIPSQPGQIKKISKPKYSRIHLTKSYRELNIYFGLKGFTAVLDQKITGTNIVINYFFLTLFFLYILASLIFVYLSFVLLKCAILITILLAIITFFTNEETYVKLQRNNKIKIHRQSFGLVYGVQVENLSNILGVFIREIDSDHCAVIIRSETRTHQILRGLKERESLWLVQEIQDWINYR